MMCIRDPASRHHGFASPLTSFSARKEAMPTKAMKVMNATKASSKKAVSNKTKPMKAAPMKAMKKKRATSKKVKMTKSLKNVIQKEIKKAVLEALSNMVTRNVFWEEVSKLWEKCELDDTCNDNFENRLALLETFQVDQKMANVALRQAVGPGK